MAIVKLIFLGNFEQGFEVTLQIANNSVDSFVQAYGKLPPAPNIPQIYANWRSNYIKLDDLYPRARKGQTTLNIGNILELCRESSEEFRTSVRDWLNNYKNSEFQKIREEIIRKLDTKVEHTVFIQTQDEVLKKLPWDEWDLFSDTYTEAEIVLSPLNITGVDSAARVSRHTKVRILAILGNSAGINVQADREFLKSLPSAEVHFLPEPPRKDLSDRLWEQDWDILFFAGHSESGTIAINETERLTISDLRHGLRKAIAQGLQLAIFNSCDGLKLADNLADLHIPQVIVMREPVPDKFAQQFLKYFLTAYSGGKSLYMAVQSARKRLHTEGLEDKFPGATWLPVICQNPAVKPLTWQEFLDKTDKKIPYSDNGTWKCVHTLTEHIDWFYGRNLLKISPDGLILASGNADKTIKLWDLKTRKLLRTLTGYSEEISCVAFSPDSKILASGSDSSPIKLWDWQTGELLGTLKEDFLICWTPFSLAFSPDGQTLAAAYNDTTIKLWDWQRGELLRTLRGHAAVAKFVAFSPVSIASALEKGKNTGETLVSCSRDNTVKIWNTRTGENLHTLNGFSSSVLNFAATFAQKSVSGFTNIFNIDKAFDGLNSIAISPDRQTIASCGYEPQINLWHLDTGELLGTLKGHSEQVQSIAFSPDGQTLASASDDRTIRIWNWRSGEMLNTLGQHSDTVCCVAFSPDGQTLVSSSVDKTIKIWRTSP